LHGKSHALDAYAAQLDGLGRIHQVMSFDGKRLVVNELNGGQRIDELNTLHVLKAHKGTFREERYTQSLSNYLAVAELIGSRVYTALQDSTDYRNTAAAVMKRNLKKRVWEIPSSPGGFIRLYANGVVARLIDGVPSRVEVRKKGRLLATHVLPAVPYGSRVAAQVDRRGGVMYWYTRLGTNGPLTYLDRRGRTIFNGFVPAGMTDFSRAQIGRGILLLERWEGPAARLRAYKLGKTPELLGESVVPYVRYVLFLGRKLLVGYAGGGTAGARMYDRKLRRITWEGSAPGYDCWWIDGTAYVLLSSNATTRTFSVYRRSKEIATHTYVP